MKKSTKILLICTLVAPLLSGCIKNPFASSNSSLSSIAELDKNQIVNNAYNFLVSVGYRGSLKDFKNELKGKKSNAPKSAYEIFKDNFPNYDDDCEDWIEDLLDGDLEDYFDIDDLFNSESTSEGLYSSGFIPSEIESSSESSLEVNSSQENETSSTEDISSSETSSSIIESSSEFSSETSSEESLESSSESSSVESSSSIYDPHNYRYGSISEPLSITELIDELKYLQKNCLSKEEFWFYGDIINIKKCRIEGLYDILVEDGSSRIYVAYCQLDSGIDDIYQGEQVLIHGHGFNNSGDVSIRSKNNEGGYVNPTIVDRVPVKSEFKFEVVDLMGEVSNQATISPITDISNINSGSLVKVNVACNEGLKGFKAICNGETISIIDNQFEFFCSKDNNIKVYVCDSDLMMCNSHSTSDYMIRALLGGRNNAKFVNLDENLFSVLAYAGFEANPIEPGFASNSIRLYPNRGREHKLEYIVKEGYRIEYVRIRCLVNPGLYIKIGNQDILVNENSYIKVGANMFSIFGEDKQMNHQRIDIAEIEIIYKKI